VCERRLNVNQKKIKEEAKYHQSNLAIFFMITIFDEYFLIWFWYKKKTQQKVICFHEYFGKQAKVERLAVNLKSYCGKKDANSR
jgi:hypothetical protein